MFLTTRVADTSFHSKSLERFAELKNSGVENLGRMGEDTNLGQG
jgi:hypothetical protein